MHICIYTYIHFYIYTYWRLWGEPDQEIVSFRSCVRASEAVCPRGDVASLARALSLQSYSAAVRSALVQSVPFLLAYMLPIDREF